MMEQVGVVQGLDTLFSKLGHHLPEIRTRALSSILSKLDHGLLHESNLIHERQLFIKLLEWFNYHPAPMKGEVFKLMLLLSKHSHAKELLVSLGAIQFLTDLRRDMSPSLRSDLDSVLENLLHTTENISRGDRCLYRSVDSAQNSDAVSRHEINPNRDVTSGYFEDAAKNIQAQTSAAFGHEDTSSFITYPGFPWHFLTATDRHVLSSTSMSLCSSNSNLIQNACSFLLDVVLCDFPTEIFLQRPTIINTLLTLLKSRPGADLTSVACECLSYIARNLLGRILFFQDPNFHCPRQGLPLPQGSLFDSGHMRQYSEVSETGQERNGGDGRDENSSSSVSSTFNSVLQSFDESSRREVGNDEDDSLEDDHIASLQLAQFSSHHFCISCLQTAIPLLLVESPTLFLRAYDISIHCIQVLNHILDADALWKAGQNSAKNFQADIESLAKLISRAVLYHYHLECQDHPKQSKSSGIAREGDGAWSVKMKSKHEAEFNRVAYQACASLLIGYLKTLVPVPYSQTINTDLVTTALYAIACDELLPSLSCKDLALAYLSQCNDDKHKAVSKLQVVLKSISDTHSFLASRGQEQRNSGNVDSVLGLGESALNALPYYTEDRLIPSLVHAISDSYAGTCVPQCNAGRRILLKLLAYPFANVRCSVYGACYRIMSTTVSVTSASDDPSRDASLRCLFLMSSEVLYEILLHGVCDPSPLVSCPAQDLILCLIRGKVLMKEELWQNCVRAMKSVLPVLQTHMSQDQAMQRAITEFISDNFGRAYNVQFLLRCLFLKQRSVRVVAGERLLKLLLRYRKELAEGAEKDEDDSIKRLIDYAASIIDLTDLLIVDKPLALSSPLSASSTMDAGIFDEDAVVKMLGIYRSRTIACSVRRSALQQLSVILHDHNLHKIFLKSNGLDSVRLHMQTLATNSALTDNENSEVLACIAITRAVALWDEDIRMSLIECNMLLGLLKLADLCRSFPVTSNLVSQTLALLLMNDVMLVKEEEGASQLREPSLPSRVLSCYQIPFLCSAHDVISRHRTIPSPPTDYDPLLSGPAAFAVKARINQAQNDGKVADVIEMLALRQENSGMSEGLVKRSDSLLLQAHHISVIYSDAFTAMERIVSTIQKACAHAAVCHVLSLLRILLRSSPELYYRVMFSSHMWRKAVEKFLLVLPSSSKDMELLCSVVGMLGDLLDIKPSENFCSSWSCNNETNALEDTLLWYLQMCVPEEPSCHTKVMPLFALLQTSEVQNEQSDGTVLSVAVQRQLSKSILSMVSIISRRINSIKDNGMVYKFQAILCRIILLRLKLADTPRFYDLPSMEATLHCLVNNTAASGWTNAKVKVESFALEGTKLCTQLLTSLLEVVSAFHIENRGSNMSYMGKGVSRSATRGIVHLVFELATKANPASHNTPAWLEVIARSLTLLDAKEGDNRAAKIRKPSFEWILALWSGRDPRIRYSGLALGVALTSTLTGCELIKSNFHKYGGIWKVTFSVLFDCTECSAVRAQAASLLCNLVSNSFQPDGDGDLMLFVKLLNQVKFSQNIADLLCRYHSSYMIQPMTILYSPFLSSASATTSDTSLRSGSDQPQPHPSYQQPHSFECMTENSNSSDLPSEWRAVCTPVLVTAVCRLLRSILAVSKDAMIMLHQDDVIDKIAHMLDYQVLLSYLGECTPKMSGQNVAEGRFGLAAHSLIDQYIETCKMLHVYAAQDKVAALTLLEDTDLVTNFVNLITIVSFDENCFEEVLHLHRSATDFLSYILHQCRPRASSVIIPIISSVWPSFSKTVQYILAQKHHGSNLSMFSLLSNLLIPQITLRSAIPSVRFEHALVESDMSIFCSLLIEIFESDMTKALEDWKVIHLLDKCADALQASFASFAATKVKASESGFLENVVGEVKRLDGQLQLLAVNGKQSLASSKSASKSIQSATDHVLKKLLVLLRILGSLLIENEEMQSSATNLEFGLLLEKLFSWTVIFPKLKSHVLKLMTCYTFNSDQACSSLAVTMPGHQPLVHHLISEARDLNSRALISRKVKLHHLQAVYQILCNLSVSRECRSLIWKSGIIKEFAVIADRGQHPKSTKQQRMLLTYWLKMFYSLSYFSDGQLNILKISDILEVFLSISENAVHYEAAVKILRNLCYHAPSKPRISSNKASFDMLTKGINTTSRGVVISALWALLSNSQKSKVHLKVAGLTTKIHSALASENRKAVEEQDKESLYRLTAILDGMQT